MPAPSAGMRPAATAGLVVLLSAARVAGAAENLRPTWCPEPWAPSRCLGTSSAPASGPQVAYSHDDERITWKEGMAGHSHYAVSANRTALFVIDPQQVYAACPKAGPPFKVPDLIAGPETQGFDGHSPLCCEGFGGAVANINRLAERSRALGVPVFVMAHVYRDLDGDGKVDNCGRLCDYDVLGWTGWPMAWMLWSAETPWHSVVYKSEETPQGFQADFARDFYAEKSIYSAFTEPVVAELRARGVDTVIVTGFMTQYCCVTSARHGSDLGFRIVFVADACDGPILAELLSGTDENAIVPFHLGIAVADTISTEDLLGRLEGKPGRSEL